MSESNPAKNSSSKRILKILFSILCVILICFIICVSTLPSILSTHWGNEKLTAWVNSRIAGKVAFENLKISWLGEQTLENAQLFDPQGQQIASLNLLKTNVSLLGLLLNKRQGNYELAGLQAKLVQDSNGQLNIRQALSNENYQSGPPTGLLTVLLNDVNGVASLNSENGSHIQIAGRTLQGKQEGTFSLNASLEDISKNSIIVDKRHLNVDKIGQMQLHADFNNFPVSLLDEALAFSKPQYKGLLLAAFGDKLNLNIQQSKGKEGIELKLNIQSPFVKGVLNGILKEDHFVINEPDSLEMILQPQLIERLNYVFFDEDKILLKKPTKGLLNISKMHLDYDFDGAFIDLARSSILANLAIDQADLQLKPPIGDVSLEKFNFMLDASESRQATIQAKVITPQKNVVLSHLLGTEMNLDMHVVFGKESTQDFTAQIQSATALAKAEGQIQNFKKLFLSSPALILYNLSPAAINALGLDNFKLDSSSQIQIQINPDPKGIRFSDLAALELHGLLKIDQINLYGNAGAIHQLSVPWEIHAPENLINLQVQATTKLNSGRLEGTVDGTWHFSHWLQDGKVNFNGAQLNGQLKLANFPVAFIEKISGQQDLISFIGQALNIDFAAQFSSFDDLTGDVQLSVLGKDFQGQGSFIAKNGLVVKQPGVPAKLKLNLVPDQFESFRKRFLSKGKRYPEVTLMAPSQVVFNLNSLSMPLKTDDVPRWLKANVEANLSIDKLALQDKMNAGQVWFQDIQGSLESPELARNLSFSLSGRHYQKGSTPLPFSINGRADHTFTSTGELNSDNLALSLDTQFEKFPVRILGQFLSMGDEIPQRISAVLGDTINANVHIQIDHLKGPVLADISGNNGHVLLDGKINNGILTLNKNFRTEIALTKEFGQAILKDIFPLASGLIGADNPLVINIDANGFVLPVKNFDIKSVQIGSASLELGKVRFRNDGQLGTILSLFNTSGTNQISVWFTPLYIEMKNGAIAFKRMDMLIMDAYPIATWGTVNLAADQVNMIIGLTAQALKKGFNIPDLGKNYVLQIPFQGNIHNASIEKKKAIAKIAALVASNRGPEGVLIGTALHIASGGLTEEKAPPPTTNPLPWSIGEDSAKSEPKQTDTQHPLHQVEDKATSLLRNLLPF